MSQATPTRVQSTRAALLAGALQEFSAFGYRRSSMESVADRAGVSRATLYLHWNSKEALFRALVEQLHAEHVAAMEAVLTEVRGDLEARILAILEARFQRSVELTSASAHAAELYDLHGRLCGDLARASQGRSERLLARVLRQASSDGEADLKRSGLSASRAAAVLFDCAHGAKGEDPSTSTPSEFSARLARIVRVLVTGLAAAP